MRAGRRRRRILTIDGPAGTGKSVTARAVASRLGILYLDSGALYRAIALAADRAGLRGSHDPRLGACLAKAPIEARYESGEFRVFLEGENVTRALRSEEVGRRASLLATEPTVRAHVGRLLQELAEQHDCVVEGRDMGSTVFPDADLKIYLTAALETRIRRRIKQLQEQGHVVDEELVGRELTRRDERDSSRQASPLRFPPGAVRVDTSELALAQQIALIEDLYRGGGWRQGSPFYRTAHRAARFAFLCLLGVRVSGTERIPHGPCLIASNHRSYLDPPLVGTLHPGAIAFMAKEELFRIPLLGPLIGVLNALPVRRGQVDRRALRASLAALGHLMPLLIFPEGTRVRGGKLGRPRSGVAYLARRAQVPVVPVRIWGGGLWRSLLRLEPICVSFGPPLAYRPAAAGKGDSAFTAEVMEAVERLGPSSPP
jgi:cytidylate kinase